MKKQTYEITNWQIFPLSRVTIDGATDNQAWSRFRRCCRSCRAHSSQFTLAALTAGILHHLATGSGDVAALLNVMAAIAAFAYIGLVIQSRNGTQALLNVLAAPVIFAAAYTGFLGDPAWLTVSFALHGIISALQIKHVDKDLQAILIPWAVFCGVLVVLPSIG